MSSSQEQAVWTAESAFDLELAKREATAWIEAVTKRKLTQGFAPSLRDGVALCELVNRIERDTIDKIHQSSIPFLQMENLAFVAAAARKWGIPDTENFESEDLFNEKNIRQVIICLYYMGRYARALATYTGPLLPLLQAVRCSECSQPIQRDEAYLETMSAQYHFACKPCVECGRVLGVSEPYEWREDDGGLLCLRCVAQPPNREQAQEEEEEERAPPRMCAYCGATLGSEDGDGPVHKGRCECATCELPLSAWPQAQAQARDEDKSGGGGGGSSSSNHGSSTGDGDGDKDNHDVYRPMSELEKANKVMEHKDELHHVACLSCHSCEESFDSVGEVIPYVNRKRVRLYHVHCLCGVCQREIIAEEDDVLVLSNGTSYNHLQCIQCAHCQGSVQADNYARVGDLVYCEQCVCKECGVVGATKALCVTCASKKGEPCAGCGQPLGADRLKAMGKRWHEECFVCTLCRSPFPGDTFLVLDNMPYCEPCHAIEQAKRRTDDGQLCARCNNQLGPKRVKALDKKWHPECFVCAKCASPFADGRFAVTASGEPVCGKC